MIDADIVRDGNVYYRFIKDEKFKAITMESARSSWMGRGKMSRALRWRSYAGMRGRRVSAQVKPAADGKPATWCLLLDFYSRGQGV